MKGDLTPGARSDGKIARLNVGEYGKQATGEWYCRTPTGLLGNLSRHDITEHEDGTITVSPSIEVLAGKAGRWHGFLERGVWREDT